MDFSISDEQSQFIELTKKFAIEEVKPWIRFIEQKGDSYEGHIKAREILKKAALLGLSKLGFPQEYGGIPCDPITIGLIAETLCRYAGLPRLEATSSLFGIHGPAMTIAKVGSREQKEELLPKIMSGDYVVSIAATEPSCGSDISKLKTSAVLKDDEYVVNGEKQMVSGTRWSDAHLVFCRTSEGKGTRGISAILVEDTKEGISRYQFKTMCDPFWELGGIVYNDVRVPSTNLVGAEGAGFYQMMGMFDWMRALIGATCIGMAQGALDETISYVKKREAFGQPIGKWEAVQFRISEDATQLEAARWLTYRTLWLAGKGLPHSKESSMVKWWVPSVCFNILNDCIQNKGAFGYTDESMDELKLRFIRAHWIADGTIDVQKIVIGREILGKEFVPYH
ncbi:MAG: acyl-CoA dehydrogenase family protein [Nitrososphaerales archaeon]